MIGPTVEAHRGNHNGSDESVEVPDGTPIAVGTGIDPTAGAPHGGIPMVTETVDITTASVDGIDGMMIDTGKGAVAEVEYISTKLEYHKQGPL